MDLFFSSILLVVSLFVTLGFLLGLIKENEGECDANSGYNDMKQVAIVTMILIAISTIYFVFKIIKIVVKRIQIRRSKRSNKPHLSSDEEDDKD